MRLLVRALVAFLALPGMVAFAIPVALGWPSPRRAPLLALAPLALGTLLLLRCVREFYVAGRGTLGPWSPPRQLVTSGPYRLSRNPMYLGVLTILAGWCVLWDSPTLLAYTLLVAIGFHLRVVFAEEPWAAGRFGEEWSRYRQRVPRWLFPVHRRRSLP